MGVSSAVRVPRHTCQRVATEKQENAQESDEAHENESKTTEVDETACGKYCSRVVKHVMDQGDRRPALVTRSTERDKSRPKRRLRCRGKGKRGI